MLAVEHRRFNVTTTLIASAWHVVVPCTRAFTVFRGQPVRSRLAPAGGSKTRRARARRAGVSRASVRGLVRAGPRRHQVGGARGRAAAGRFAGGISRDGISARLSAPLV